MITLLVSLLYALTLQNSWALLAIMVAVILDIYLAVTIANKEDE